MLGRGNKGRKVSFVDDHIKNDDWLEEALTTDSDNEAPSRTSAAGTNKDKSDKSDKSNTAVTEGGDRDGGEEAAELLSHETDALLKHHVCACFKQTLLLFLFKGESFKFHHISCEPCKQHTLTPQKNSPRNPQLIQPCFP